jgi:hypothetical protein
MSDVSDLQLQQITYRTMGPEAVSKLDTKNGDPKKVEENLFSILLFAFNTDIKVKRFCEILIVQVEQGIDPIKIEWEPVEATVAQ